MSTFYRFALCGICSLAMLTSTAVLTAQQAPGPPGEDGRAAQANGRPVPRGKFAGMSTEVGSSPKSSTSGGFVDLLESGDLSSFRGYKSEEIGPGWKINGKYLHFDGTKSGDIVTVEQYDNFELQFDWKVGAGGNSGVMYRVSLGDGAPYFSGPEYQVLDDTKHKDGQKQLTSAGSIYGLYAPKGDKKRKSGVWNKAKIIVDGNKITHYVNNKKVVDAVIDSSDWRERVAGSKFKSWEKFGKNRSGHIAFQDHGDEVYYRNIKIRSLDGKMAKAETKPKKRAGRSKFEGMMQAAPGAGPGGPPAEPAGGQQKQTRKANTGKKWDQMQTTRPGAAGPSKGGKSNGGSNPGSAPGG